MSMLNVPDIHPEELLEGYVGRVMELNGCANEFPQISEKLLQEACGRVHPKVRFRILSFSSVVLDRPREDLSRLHTNSSFEACIEWRNGRLPDSHAIARKGVARFCLDCVKEDIAFWGYAYWRRRHQLPGIERCTKHVSRLHVARTDHAALPSIESFLGVAELPMVFGRSKAVSRRMALYETVLEALLDGGHSIKHMTIRRRLARRATDLGMAHWWGNDISSSMGAYVTRLFPLDWLRMNFLKNQKRSLNIPSLVDRIFGPERAPSVEQMVLAAVAFSKSCEEVLAFFSPTGRQEIAVANSIEQRANDVLFGYQSDGSVDPEFPQPGSRRQM